MRRAIRKAGQVLLCAGALAGGAMLAHATSARSMASASAPVAVFPPPMPPPAVIEREEAPVPTATVMASAEPAPVDDARVLPPLRPFGERLRDGRPITGSTPHRMVLFTFDDGPDPRHTPRLLDTLDRLGVKAVFFLTASRLSGHGPWVRRNQAIARDIVARGHMIANHTVDHAQLPLLDDAQVLAQVEGVDRIFERVLGGRAWLIRPPGGARSERVDALLASRGYTQVLWNLGAGDHQVRTPEEVFRLWRRVLERREREDGDRGGIVLLHDTHEWSVDAVPLIVGWMRDQNCELVEEGEELYDVVSDPSFFFVERGEARASDDAPPATPNRAVIAERQRMLRIDTRRRCSALASR